MDINSTQKKRYREYSVTFGALFLITGICIIGRPLNSLDELWQYSVGSNIAKGLLPYRDINMAVTPLSGIIGGIAIKILGEELIVYRILGTLLCTACMMVFYDILRNMEIEEKLVFCLCIYISVFYGMYFTCDYNYWVLLMLLLIMDLLLRQGNTEGRQSHSRWFAIGNAAGCAVLFKQSTGLVVFVVTSALVWIFGSGRKNVLCYVIGWALPVGLCIGWLFPVREAFWDYTFGGMHSFRQHNSVSLWTFLFHSGLLCTVEAVLAIVIVVVAVRKLLQSREEQMQKKWLVILSLSAAGMAVVYPIADDAHFGIALLPVLILGICELPAARACQQKGLFRLAVLIVAMGTGVSLWFIREDDVIWSQLTHYRGIRVDRSVEQMVWEVNDYLNQYSGITVYILDGTAMLYKIPMDRYDKDYDMCLAGNWGSRTSEEMAQALLQRKGVFLLAMDEYGVNWQVPEDFLEYIRSHASCVDHIGKYDVYIAE